MRALATESLQVPGSFQLQLLRASCNKTQHLVLMAPQQALLSAQGCSFIKGVKQEGAPNCVSALIQTMKWPPEVPVTQKLCHPSELETKR